MVEVDGKSLVVVKFRGAGQGARVLVAELIVGLVAQRLGLPVPELSLVHVAERFGRNEPDSEIRQLLRASHGMNVGTRYLPGAFNFDPHAAGDLVSPELAARIVWLDALVTNPDRTARNPNLLIWERRLWLIDHGASLYAHHDWSTVDDRRTATPFALIRSHVLLARAGDLAAADAACAPLLPGAVLREILDAVPDALLMDSAAGPPDFDSADAARARYVEYLRRRLAEPRGFVEEAISAQTQVRIEVPQHRPARR